MIFLDIDECESEPCQNGAICIDDINEYSCNCTQGFHGDHCQHKGMDKKIHDHSLRVINSEENCIY